MTDPRQAEIELERLAGEQAALRRVATLVARQAAPAEVFAAIAEELGRLMGPDHVRMWRFEGDSAVAVASTGAFDSAMPVGMREALHDHSLAGRVRRTGRSQRVDDYVETGGRLAERALEIGVGCAVATPIVVEGRLWGAMVAASRQPGRIPADAEQRMDEFTELMATAIGNTESRAEVTRLAEEQAALRRVAMLVAQGASPTAVFDAVAAEIEALLGSDGVLLARYEPGDEVTVVAHRGQHVDRLRPGTRARYDDESVSAEVRRTERPARREGYPEATGALHDLARDVGVRAAVGAPIVVEGRLWGVTLATWAGDEPPHAGTEQRMAQFAELLDTAIANADSRDQLTASRARLLTAADEARRRVVRDLHDGAQQRLVHTIVTLQLAQQALAGGEADLDSLIGEALEHAQQGNAELRELAHGLLPTALTHGGLRAGVDAVVSRLDLPVEVDVPAERFAAEIEASAYFLVAEALTNVVKHAQATRAEVRISVEDGMLRVVVHDDGIGGADPEGHGLVGLGDRATALGGRLTVESPPGGGTTLAAEIPIGD